MIALDTHMYEINLFECCCVGSKRAGHTTEDWPAMTLLAVASQQANWYCKFQR